MSRISIGFLGNMYFDTRTRNLFHSLTSRGHEVFFFGFDWETPDFPALTKTHVCIRKLKKNRFSVLFYVQFARQLSVQLMRHRSDFYVASDFYSLPFCAMAARWWGSKLIYDSRELYTELPAFHDKTFFKWIVRCIEKWCVQKAHSVTTTGSLDARYLFQLYGIQNTVLLRNLPCRQGVSGAVDYATRFPCSVSGKLLVYQGILVPGRGIETAFRVLQQLPSAGLVLLGDGDFNVYYRKMSDSLGIRDRVCFAGKIPQETLLRHTAGTDIGLSLIDNVCDNNFLALPNKLFEYIMAGLPVVVTDLPQMKAVVEQYRVGAVVPVGDADAVVDVLQRWDSHPSEFNALRENCRKASRILNWETEFENVYEHLFHV